MLEGGVFCYSTSPYSSFVVMVLKTEGTLCMCLDFHSLKNVTIKEKILIPIIDDLMDEINGAQYFNKFDACSSYHLICMKEEDIPNIVFHTHEGQYGFLDMPFGLSNAPSTFQILMNHILHPFLHHFVLVFFDDVLISNQTWKPHITHVDQVLHMLFKNNLFLN
jgi:hypothetical protein